MRRAQRYLLPATVAVLVAGVGLLAGTIRLNYPLAWVLTALVAVACVGVAVYSVSSDRDPLSPLVLISMTFTILFVFRPAYILASGVTGPTRRVEDEALNANIASAMVTASSLALVALVSLLLGTLCFRALNPHAPRKWRELRSRLAEGMAREQLNSHAALIAVIVTGLLAAFSYYRLIADAGGLSAYVSALSLRSEVFFGKGYLAQIALPLKAVALVVLTFWLTRRRFTAVQRLWLGMLIGFIMVGDFLTGGRASLILGTLLPLAVLQHYLRSPLRARILVPLVLFAMVFFVGSRVATRDAVYASSSTGSPTSGQSIIDITTEQLTHLPRSTVGGRDAVPYDSIVRMVRAERSGQRPLFGATYLPIFTFPIPRAVWADKPTGGANTWFTRKYYPGFYGTARTETSVSEIGELYVNFGPGGIALGFFLIGVGVSWLYRALLYARSMWNVLLYGVTMTYVLTLLRGDAFHSVTTWVLTVIVVFLSLRFMTVQSSPRSEAGRAPAPRPAGNALRR